MKNLKTRSVMLTLSFILSASLFLSACSKSNTSTNEASPSTTAAANTETAKPADAAKIDAPDVLGVKLEDLNGGGTLTGQYKGKKLKLATVDGDFADAVKEVVPYFEKVSGASVEVQSFPGETFMEKIQLDLQTSHTFDAVLMPVASIHGYAQAGLVQDLTPFTQKIASPNLDLADFIPSLLNIYGKYQGKLVALPFKPDVQLFFYRKDLFEDPKIQASFKQKTGKDLAVPTTVEDYYTTAAYFTKSLNPDSPTDYGYSTMGSKGNSRWIWTNRLGAFGGKDLDGNFKAAFNNDAGMKALQTVLELKKYAPKELTELQWENANKLFTDGKVAMMEQWPGLYSSVQGDKSAVKDKVGIAVTPGGAPTIGGWALSVTSATKEPDLAYKLIEYIESKDVQLMMIKHTVDPTRTSNYNRPEIAASNTMYPVLFKSLAAAKILADVDAPLISPKLNDIEEAGIQSALKGDMTPQQALKSMEDNFNKETKAVGLSK